MGARYVYWRTPTGGPYKGQDNKHAPCGLLSEIGNSASINAEGRVSWPLIPFLQFEQVILGSVAVLDADGQELSPPDAQTIVQTAIRSVIKKRGGQSPVDPTALVREADKEAAAFVRREFTDYVLITSLSVNCFPAKRVAFERCQVTPLRGRGRYLYPDVLQREYAGKGKESLTGRNKYQLVRVKITGRSIFEAAHRALESLAFLRGLWNLFATFGSWSIGFGSRRQKPIGVIHIGPIHTLHKPDGAPVGDLYWYEPDFVEQHELFAPKKGWESIEKHRRWAMKRMRTLSFARDLRQLIVRYAVALGNANSDIAFLQMWAVLESLTNTVGARYDDTVDRATWIFKTHNHARELLQYLRCRRNQYVHAARSDDDRHQVAQLMKTFIDSHLLRLLRNDLNVHSLEEYASYLTLPTSVDELRKSQQRLRRALRLRESWRKDK